MSTEPINRHDIFAEKYSNPNSDWGGHGSGPGSDPFYNLPYRAFIENFLVQNHISSVLDIGCGDWAFSRFIRFERVRYVGLDVVENLVERNSRLFGTDSISFDVMPDDMANTPPAQLLIMKDVLQHQTNSDIKEFYEKVVPIYEICLITNSYRKATDPTNTDIPTGGFRCLDPRSEPYSWRGSYVLQFTTGVWEEIRTLLILNQR